MAVRNRAFRAEGQTVYTVEAHAPSNTWFGASQVLAKVYRQRILGADDLILDLVGGRFALIDGEKRHVRFGPARRHPFERGGNDEPLPEGMTEVAYDPETMRAPLHEPERLDVRPAEAQVWGGLPDWLLPS